MRRYVLGLLAAFILAVVAMALAWIKYLRSGKRDSFLFPLRLSNMSSVSSPRAPHCNATFDLDPSSGESSTHLLKNPFAATFVTEACSVDPCDLRLTDEYFDEVFKGLQIDYNIALIITGYALFSVGQLGGIPRPTGFMSTLFWAIWMLTQAAQYLVVLLSIIMHIAAFGSMRQRIMPCLISANVSTLDAGAFGQHFQFSRLDFFAVTTFLAQPVLISRSLLLFLYAYLISVGALVYCGAGDAASGLKWKRLGSVRPCTGLELVNKELTQALSTKAEFTQAEWDTFGVRALRMDHFVSSSNEYFAPVAAETKAGFVADAISVKSSHKKRQPPVPFASAHYYMAQFCLVSNAFILIALSATNLRVFSCTLVVFAWVYAFATTTLIRSQNYWQWTRRRDFQAEVVILTFFVIVVPTSAAFLPAGIVIFLVAKGGPWIARLFLNRVALDGQTWVLADGQSLSGCFSFLNSIASPVRSCVGWLGTLNALSIIDGALMRPVNRYFSFSETCVTTLAGGMSCYWCILAISPMLMTRAWFSIALIPEANSGAVQESSGDHTQRSYVHASALFNGTWNPNARTNARIVADDSTLSNDTSSLTLQASDEHAEPATRTITSRAWSLMAFDEAAPQSLSSLSPPSPEALRSPAHAVDATRLLTMVAVVVCFCFAVASCALWYDRRAKWKSRGAKVFYTSCIVACAVNLLFALKLTYNVRAHIFPELLVDATQVVLDHSVAPLMNLANINWLLLIPSLQKIVDALSDPLALATKLVEYMADISRFVDFDFRHFINGLELADAANVCLSVLKLIATAGNKLFLLFDLYGSASDHEHSGAVQIFELVPDWMIVLEHTVADALSMSVDTLRDLPSGKLKLPRSNEQTWDDVATLVQANRLRFTHLEAKHTDPLVHNSLIDLLQQQHLQLSVIDLSDSTIGSSGAIHIAEHVKYSTTLTSLNVSCNRICERTSQLISAARHILMYRDDRMACNRFLNNLASCIKPLFLSNLRDYDASGIKALSFSIASNTVLKSLDLSLNNIGEEGAKTIAKALESGTAPLTSLNVSKNSIGAEGAKAIATVLGRVVLKSLDLAHNSIGAEGVEATTAALGSAVLTDLNLSENSIGAEGTSAIVAALGRSVLKRLDTRDDSINGEAAQQLAATVLESKSLEVFASVPMKEICEDKVTQLDLSNNTLERGRHLGPTEGILLSKLMNLSTVLQKIVLSGNQIKDEGAIAVAESLKSNESLKELELVDCGVGVNGTKALATALSEGKAVLTSLDLSSNDIGGYYDNKDTFVSDLSGVQALASALAGIAVIKLSSNRLCGVWHKDDQQMGIYNSSGIRALASALASGLCIRSNGIGAEGARAIASALIGNAALTTLDIVDNNIGADGANAIAAVLGSSVLKKLNVDGAELNIEQLKGTDPVEAIDLSYETGLRSASGILIAKCIESNAVLKSLDLSNSALTNYGQDMSGIKALAAALGSSVLTSVNVGGNGLREDAALDIVRAAWQHDKITSLGLAACNIGPVGAKEIAEYVSVSSALKTLYLNSNRVRLEGAKAIASALQSGTALTSLDLRSNWNSDEDEEASRRIKKVVAENAALNVEL